MLRGVCPVAFLSKRGNLCYRWLRLALIVVKAQKELVEG
jgi:hypothetical protein